MTAAQSLLRFRDVLVAHFRRDPGLRVSEIEASLVEGSTVLLYCDIDHNTEVVSFELEPNERFDCRAIEAGFLEEASRLRAAVA